MSINVTGEIIVFKNKNNTGYYTSTVQKDAEGNFNRNYITVGFRKGVEVENYTKIKIKDGFLTHYLVKNEEDEEDEEEKRFKIMILDFEVVQTYSKNNENTNTQNTTENDFNGMNDVIYPDDDFPF